jgi:hypothetical protein
VAEQVGALQEEVLLKSSQRLYKIQGRGINFKAGITASEE